MFEDEQPRHQPGRQAGLAGAGRADTGNRILEPELAGVVRYTHYSFLATKDRRGTGVFAMVGATWAAAECTAGVYGIPLGHVHQTASAMHII